MNYKPKDLLQSEPEWLKSFRLRNRVGTDLKYKMPEMFKYGESYTDKTYDMTLPMGTKLVDPQTNIPFRFGAEWVSPEYMPHYVRALGNAAKKGSTFRDEITGLDVPFGAPIRDPVSGLQFKAGYAFTPSKQFEDAYRRAIQSYGVKMLSGSV